MPAARKRPVLIIDGQNLADPLPVGLDLENFIRALADSPSYQLEVVVDRSFPRQRPALANDYPEIRWHRLELDSSAESAWSPLARDQRQQALNRWLADEGLIGRPFVVANSLSRQHYPTWPAHSPKICLWPNLFPPVGELPRQLDLVAQADLILTPTQTLADELVATRLADPDRVVVVGQGGLGLKPPKPSAPNPRPEGNFVIWPTAADEAETNQLVAVAWRLFKKQTRRPAGLVVVGDPSPTQKAEIRGQTGRQVLFGQRLTAERLAWLYQQAAAVLMIRRRPGRLTPFLAAAEAGRPIIANQTADLAEIAPADFSYCPGKSILEIARALDLAFDGADQTKAAQLKRQLRDFNWAETARRFRQAEKQLRPREATSRPTTALIGRSQLPPGGAGLAIGNRPPVWTGQQLDYFYEGRPLDRSDDDWLSTTDLVSYRPLVDLPDNQLSRYRNRIYYLANHPGCYQTMMRALIQPGIVVAPSLRFDLIWRQLIAAGFVSQKRWQVEIQAEARAGVDDDCRGAWSLIKRSAGLVVDNDSDVRAARKIKVPANRIQLASDNNDWWSLVDRWQPKPPKPTTTYIDISSLANNWLSQAWLTGIQRYEHQLLVQARRNWPELEYVFWQTGPEVLAVIPPPVIDQLVGLIGDHQSGHSQQLSRRQGQLKRTLTAINHHLVANPGDRLLVSQGLWESHPYAKTISRLSRQMAVHQIVHDLVPIVRPEYTTPLTQQSFANYLAQIAPSRPGFITISNNSLADLRDYHRRLGLPAPKASVCPLGDNPVDQKTDPEPIPALVDQPFILSVGTIEPRKNYQLLLETYQLDDSDSLPTLCIVGRVGWLVDDLLARLKDQPKIILLTNANDRQLAWLYQNCRLTVFPSLYEGWGLPVAESLAWGCPTLCSSAASLPEVGGNLADYFDPANPKMLLKLIRRYLQPAINRNRRSEIKQKYQPRAWADSIDQLLKPVASPSRQTKA